MDSKRIAVLISGEYRTFDICRPTMTFLDDPRVDVYFSTWDRTIVKNEILGIDINEEITFDRVHAALGKDACVLIEKSEGFVERRYNSKMIHRWKTGFEMVRQSGVEYDYVLVVRPDWFFDQHYQTLHTIDNLLNGKDLDSLHLAWNTWGDEPKLQDSMFSGEYNTIARVLDGISVDIWDSAGENDWHIWWYHHVNRTISGKVTSMEVYSIFARMTVKRDASFVDVVNAHDDWRDAEIIRYSQSYGRSGPVVAWGEAVVAHAEAKFTSRSNKVALIISGLLRNFDVAALSIPIWGNCDKYLITWKSSEHLVPEYQNLVDLKQTIIIDDTQFNAVAHPLCNTNIFRMVYLWSESLKHINHQQYDRCIIIRPDGFYYTSDTTNHQRLLTTLGELNTDGGNHKWLSDHLVTFTNSRVDTVKIAYEDLVSIALRYHEQGKMVCIRTILHEMWGNIPGVINPAVLSSVDTIFVRDTYKKAHLDRYGYELYRNIFYDTAAWWKREVGSTYEGHLRLN